MNSLKEIIAKNIKLLNDDANDGTVLTVHYPDIAYEIGQILDVSDFPKDYTWSESFNY